MLKRDNWTNVEVKNIISKLIAIEPHTRNESEQLKEFNRGVKFAAEYFEHFNRSKNELEAFAFETQTGEIVNLNLNE